jgi:hypothetical protein
MASSEIPTPDQLLSQTEVNALPDGTRVWVRWSGGNGPWPYTISRLRNGITYARSHLDVQFNTPGSAVDFVGKERFHTLVWTAEREAS